MTGIAVGILTTPPSNGEYSQEEQALRTWAVKILENPTGLNELSIELKQILINDRFLLGWPGVFLNSDGSEIERINQMVQEMNAALRNLPLTSPPDRR